MKRIFRIDKQAKWVFYLLIFAISFTVCAIITDNDPFVTMCRFLGGICYGFAVAYFIKNIEIIKNRFERMNTKPNFDMSVMFYINDPFLFGQANDFLDKDLLLYPPLKQSIYSMKGVYDNKNSHVLCASWNKRKNIIRIFDTISLKDITDHEDTTRYYLRLVYDLKLTDKVTIIPLQVIAYDSEYCGMVFAFDKQVFRISEKDYRNDPATKSECEATCDRIRRRVGFEDFEEYFREFLEHNTMIAEDDIDPTKVPELRQIRKDIEIVIDGDDYLEIFKNNKYYLK